MHRLRQSTHTDTHTHIHTGFNDPEKMDFVVGIDGLDKHRSKYVSPLVCTIFCLALALVAFCLLAVSCVLRVALWPSALFFFHDIDF